MHDERTLAPAVTAGSPVEITLKYDGRDVDDGTMPIEDVISALRGFSNAYGKIASTRDPERQHQIRVSAIKKSSFAVSIIAWAADNKAALVAATPVAGAVVHLILKLIKLKKETKGHQPVSVKIDGNDNVVYITTAGDNTKIAVPKDVYELYHSKEIDADLSKIAAPLRDGKIDAVSLSASGDASLDDDSVVITSSERAFFQSEGATATTTSKPVEIDGHLISLNKDTNRGMFRMPNGSAVRYHLACENSASMYSDFAYRGPVRVNCVATFDQNLDLKGLEIMSTTRLQPHLFESEVDGTLR